MVTLLEWEIGAGTGSRLCRSGQEVSNLMHIRITYISPQETLILLGSSLGGLKEL